MNLIRKIRSQTFPKGPIFFGNSFPKSGTHLLLQILNGFSHLGPFEYIEDKITTFKKGKKRPAKKILAELRKINSSSICGGHLHAHPRIVSEFNRPHQINYFIYRDPRDVVVSHAFYVTEIAPKHPHHSYYTGVLKTMAERIKTSITGREDTKIEFPHIGERYKPYLPWLYVPNVLSLRYENLISTPEKQIEKIILHAHSSSFFQVSNVPKAASILVKQIQPSKSKTFREGKSGNWKHHFTKEHISLFKECAGELLIKLGYEKSLDW